MAGSFQQISPDVIQLRQGGGRIAVFGLPFLCAGVFLTLASLGVVPLSNSGGVIGIAWAGLALMGLPLLGVGGALVFGRSWTTIDATRRVVLKQWGLLVSMHEQTHRLDDYSVVRLDFERGDSDTADKFPVRLKSRAGADLPISSSTQYAEARAMAVDVARHLHLEIEDASSDHPVRLTPDQADLPLQHRARLEHEKGTHVDRPPAARSEVTNDGGGIRILIPIARLHPIALAFMLIPVAVPLFMFAPFSQFFRQTQTPGFVGWFFIGFLVLMFGVIPASTALHAFLSSRVGRTIVLVSPSGIRIQRRKVWRTKTLASHDATDIMDIDFSTTDRVVTSSQAVNDTTQRVIATLVRFAKGRGITIKTRQGMTTFGEGLADDEIRYLHSVVRRALMGI